MAVCDLTIATGGPAMVKSAYSSGKPAYGVGAGNASMVIDETANIEEAARNTAISKTNDNGSGCSADGNLLVDARIHDSTDAIRDALVRQLYLPVQWTGCVQALAARGVTRIAECGPGKVLAGLVKRIDKSLDARAIGTPGEFETAMEEWKNA